MNELVYQTYDDIKSIKNRSIRSEALNNYHKTLYKQRRQDIDDLDYQEYQIKKFLKQRNNIRRVAKVK